MSDDCDLVFCCRVSSGYSRGFVLGTYFSPFLLLRASNGVAATAQVLEIILCDRMLVHHEGVPGRSVRVLVRLGGSTGRSRQG